jgi:hypothetical protein
VPHPISAESRRRGISARPWMGASFGYAGVGSLGSGHVVVSTAEVLVASSGCCSVWVREGEANGGGDIMAVGSMGVGSDRAGVARHSA